MTSQDSRPQNLQLKSFHSTLTHTERRYWLYLPRDYGADDRRWPVVLFLHGGGERGEDPEKVLKHGVIQEVANGRDLPFLLLAPQMPSRSSVRPPRRPKPWPADTRKPMLRETPAPNLPGSGLVRPMVGTRASKTCCRSWTAHSLNTRPTPTASI